MKSFASIRCLSLIKDPALILTPGKVDAVAVAFVNLDRWFPSQNFFSGNILAVGFRDDERNF